MRAKNEPVKESIQRRINKLVTLVLSENMGFNEVGKNRFHKLGKEVLAEIAQRLKLEPGTFQIRSNRAGIASSGEVTLHADWIYIQFSQFGVAECFLYRSCKGMDDYSGGRNRWMGWAQLKADFDESIRVFGECKNGN